MSLQLSTRRLLGTQVAALLLAATAALGLGAARASSVEPNTVRFPTLAACNAGKGVYSGTWTYLTKDCTYAGRYLLGIKLDAGPYFIVYASR